MTGDPSYGHGDQRRKLSYLLLNKRLSASETAAVRTYMPFLLYNVAPALARVWQFITAYAAEYKRQMWTDEHLAHWRKLRNELRNRIRYAFHDTHADTMRNAPKFHDLHHDEQKVLYFGSLRNIDEMNHEKAHQRTKREAQHDNSKLPIEQTLLKRVHIIALLYGNAFHVLLIICSIGEPICSYSFMLSAS